MIHFSHAAAAAAAPDHLSKKRLLWTHIWLLRACESNDKFAPGIISCRLIYDDGTRMDCQQIFGLNTDNESGSKWPEVYLFRNTHTQTKTAPKLRNTTAVNTASAQNLQQQICRHLLVKHATAFWITLSYFSSFQNQLYLVMFIHEKNTWQEMIS